MFKNLIAALAFACAVAPTWAQTITLDFDDETGFLKTSNIVVDGFRLSPSCHFDVIGGGYLGSAMIALDAWHCYEEAYSNSDFLGPDEYRYPYQAPIGGSGGVSSMWIDYFGHPFRVESVFIDDFYPVSVLSS